MSSTVCSNHDVIPRYQSVDPDLFKGEYRDKPSIDSINQQLTGFTPKWIVLAGSIGAIALALLPIVGFIFFNSVALLGLGSVSGIVIASLTCLAYHSYQNKVGHLEGEIHSLFKKYTKEFILISKKYVPLIALQDDEFNLIKPYCIDLNPLRYAIYEETHCKLDGGIIGFWSVTQLKLEEVCKKTNADKTKDHYKPWIDLLIILAKTKKVAPEFLQLVGKMSGFKREWMEIVLYTGTQYDCIYEVSKKRLSCVHKTDSSKSLFITTVDECLAFAQKEFLGN